MFLPRKQKQPDAVPGATFELYDRLIEGIPPELRIKKCIIGIHWVAVHSEGVGLSMSPDNERGLPIAGTIAGALVREIAELSKSWKPLEAALGVAAINSWYNARSTVEGGWGPIEERLSTTSVFAEVAAAVAGKKVTVIGHFPDLGQLAPVCTLSILERKPQPGDYPDPACEYILPEQDFVFMTGVTLINKTMPRLIELSHRARIVLVGPSVPLSPLFAQYRVALLAGTVVVDHDRIMTHVAEGGDRSIFGNGAKTLRLPCGTSEPILQSSPSTSNKERP